MREAAAEEAFDGAAVISVRESAINIAKAFVTRCCKADALPIAPKSKHALHSVVFVFQCSQCGHLYDVKTGESCRINYDVVVEEEEEEEGEEGERGRRKKRKTTNSRPVDIVREVLGCLLSGSMYSDYIVRSTCSDMPTIHQSTFNRYIGLMLPHILALQAECIDLVRYLVVLYGESIDGLVLTQDFFWGTRGHNSDNGTGTMCDLDSGGILAVRHYCHGDDSMSNIGGYEYTSKSMDPMSCGEMLEEVITWMEEDVPKLIEEHEHRLGDIVPKLDSIVLDGDASTNALIPVVQKKMAELAKSSTTGEIEYCGKLRIRPCTNHLGKNCGGEALTTGHKWHKTCECPDRMTNQNTINQKQPKKHRGCNSQSHPLIKSYQRCLSAALRSPKVQVQKPENAGRSLSSLAVQNVEEMMNHLSNIHDGPGFITGERRVCRLHPPTKPNGELYESRQFNDCVTFNKEMQGWLKKNVTNVIDDAIHPTRGGCCQNASEHVGDVALQFRGKETALGPTHYTASTALAVIHSNFVVIHTFRRKLAAQLVIDPRIEAIGTMETNLFTRLGIPHSTAQEKVWRERVAVRAKRSEFRTTVEYKRKRMAARKQLTERRGKLKSDHKYQYKKSTGAAARAAAGERGDAEACMCTAKCQRSCPCHTANVACTTACHPSNNRCTNHTPDAAADAAAPPAAAATAVPPAAAATPPQMVPPIIDAHMVDRTIWFNFEEFGWMKGVIDEWNTDEEAIDDTVPGGDEVANFIVYYVDDDSDVPHYLDVLEYSTDRAGPPRSWYLESE